MSATTVSFMRFPTYHLLPTSHSPTHNVFKTRHFTKTLFPTVKVLIRRSAALLVTVRALFNLVDTTNLYVHSVHAFLYICKWSGPMRRLLIS
jgi:hypothetical protein